MDEASRTLGQPRDRLVRALDYLAEQGHLELKVAGVRHRFKLLDRPDDLAALAGTLHERSLQREQREIARLGQVVQMGRTRRLPGVGARRPFWRPARPAVRALFLVSAEGPSQSFAAAAGTADRPGGFFASPRAPPATAGRAPRSPLAGPIPLRRFIAPPGAGEASTAPAIWRAGSRAVSGSVWSEWGAGTGHHSRSVFRMPSPRSPLPLGEG